MAPRKTTRSTRTRPIPLSEDDEADQAQRTEASQSNGVPALDGMADGVSPEEQEVWDAVREEQYEVIEQLPLTLHRMFALLRELDEKYTSQVSELQSTIRRYIGLRQTIAKLTGTNTISVDVEMTEQSSGTVGTKIELEPTMTSLDSIFDLPANGETQKLLERIAWLNAESVRTSEEKLALATTAYDLVDRHVRSLDLTIKAEEASFALGLRPGTLPMASVMQNGTSSGIGGLALKPNGDDTTQAGASGNNGKLSRSRAKPRRPQPETVAAVENENTQPPPQSPSVDANGVAVGQLPSMAIDPNEPRYCYCNQVSFGEMIACDNIDCEREWFHYGCAGITETPKRRWFCRDCEVALGLQPRKKS